MDVLLPRGFLWLDLGRPGDEAHVGHATLIASPSLPVGKRRVEGPRPTGVVVVVGGRGAEFVDVGDRQLGGVGDSVEEPPLVKAAIRTALAAAPVVGDD